MAQGSSMIPTTGVWWDLNTCPVPSDIDPRRVRPIIESALQKFYGGVPRPVTIFAVGNLEYISPEFLKAISSTGILLRHTVFRGSSVNSYLYLWRHKRIQPPAEVLLISGDSSWFHIYNLGYTVLRAFPQYLQSSLPEWDWETLLKDDAEEEATSLSKHILKDEPAWFCDMCEIPSKSCEDFINHLKSEEHINKLFNWKKYVNPNLKFPICELCKYPAYDGYNMNIHYISEHKSILVSQVSACKFK